MDCRKSSSSSWTTAAKMAWTRGPCSRGGLHAKGAVLAEGKITEALNQKDKHTRIGGRSVSAGRRLGCSPTSPTRAKTSTCCSGTWVAIRTSQSFVRLFGSGLSLDAVATFAPRGVGSISAQSETTPPDNTLRVARRFEIAPKHIVSTITYFLIRDFRTYCAVRRPVGDGGSTQRHGHPGATALARTVRFAGCGWRGGRRDAFHPGARNAAHCVHSASCRIPFLSHA